MESAPEQISTRELDRSGAEQEMRRLKMDALEKVDHAGAEFSFLVGADAAFAEVFHCFKSDLLVASDYFRALLRSPLTGEPPVVIKHHQPHIFKIVIRFISLCVVEEVELLEDAIALGLAADEFLLVPLKLFCVHEIKRLVTVDTVWRTLNATVRIPALAEACSEVLCLETRKCLAHDSFNKASMESFIFLLDMDTLNIKAEFELVEACFLFSNHVRSKNRTKVMRHLLPHLRLKTLSPGQLDCLSRYLTNSDQALLAEGDKLVPNSRLSANCEPRRRPRQPLSKMAIEFFNDTWDSCRPYYVYYAAMYPHIFFYVIFILALTIGLFASFALGVVMEFVLLYIVEHRPTTFRSGRFSITDEVLGILCAIWKCIMLKIKRYR